MKKIPTAENFLAEKFPEFEDLDNGNVWVNIEETMIEFAKLHVTAALENENEPSCLGAVSGSAFWNDDKVIDFVNWYVELYKLDFRYKLENRTIIESFKNGDDASKWHCRQCLPANPI